MDFSTVIPWVQVLLSIVMVALILLQSSSEGGLGSLGGGEGGANYHTRRGLEKILFNATIITAILFLVLAIAELLLAA